eukprot:3669785-Prymnesium_polylepis.1
MFANALKEIADVDGTEQRAAMRSFLWASRRSGRDAEPTSSSTGGTSHNLAEPLERKLRLEKARH